MIKNNILLFYSDVLKLNKEQVQAGNLLLIISERFFVFSI